MTRRLACLVLLLTFLLDQSARSADRVSDGQWFHSYLDIAQAHTMTRGSGIKVAVVDTGVDANHPDLRGSVHQGNDLIAASDGRVDSNGHGTAMSGLIASHGRVTGVAPAAIILPVRVSTAVEAIGDKVARGIKWASDNSVDVISISSSVSVDDLLLRQEVRAAINRNIVVVAAVGNRPNDTRVGYPAAIAGVVAVAGVDRNGNRSAVSVAGPEVVIAAPSDNISSTDKGGGYREGTGTSDATAIVAGAVALIRAKYPDLKATEVVRRLTATAIDKGAPGRDPEYGYGVLNLVGALTAELPATTTTAPTATTTRTPAAPPSTGDRFPWWLIVVLPIVAVGIAAFLWIRLRRERRA